MSVRAAARDPRRVAKAAFFLTNFGAAKLAIYFIPILIAAFATADLYGGVELAQSVSLMIASLLVGAPLAGITQHLLVSGERRVEDSTALVIVLGCAFALTAFAAAWLAGASPAVLLVTAALGAAVLHLALSGYLRMLSRRNLTAWFDGTAMILAGIVTFALLAVRDDAGTRALAFAFVTIPIAGVGLGSLWLFRTAGPDLRKRFAAAIRTGIPITIIASLAMWLGLGGRIIVGFLNPAELPAYGVAFRVAGLALGVHQLATTAFYARIYASRTKVADPIIAGFLVASGVVVAAMVLAGQVLPEHVDVAALDGGGVASYRQILPATGLHTFYWIGYALLQMRISRARLARRTIAPTALVTFGGILIICAVAQLATNDIVVLAWLIAAHAAVFFVKNIVILARAGLPHRLVAMAGAGGGIFVVAVALIL